MLLLPTLSRLVRQRCVPESEKGCVFAYQTIARYYTALFQRLDVVEDDWPMYGLPHHLIQYQLIE